MTAGRSHEIKQMSHLPENGTEKRTFVTAHRYGISFAGLDLISYDTCTSVEARCKTKSIANTLHTIHVDEADRFVISV